MEPQNQNKFTKNSKYFTITVYAIVAFLICALLVKLVFQFSQVSNAIGVIFGVLSPFVIGAIFAYLINPLYKFLDVTFFGKWLHMSKRVKLRKTLSLVIAYIIVFGVLGVLIYVIVPQFVTSVRTLIATAGDFSVTVQKWLDSIQEQFKNLNLTFLTDSVATIVPKLLASVQTWAEGLLSGFMSTASSVVSGIVNFFLAIVVSIYILSDKVNLENGLRKVYYSIFKREKAATISRITRESSNIFSNFFTGKIFESLIVGILCGLLMLILRLPFPLLISVIVGLTNIIPFFGPFIGAIPSILIELMIGWKEALIFTILILVLQQIDGNLIGPKIIGDSTGLRPIWVLFAVTFGAWVGGVAGVLFGVPVMAVIGHIAEEVINNRLEKKGLDSMVERDEAPKTLNYSDMIKRMFKRKKKEDPEKQETETAVSKAPESDNSKNEKQD